MNMNEKTETLMSVIERLIGILSEENANLSERKFNVIGTSVEEKDRLCRAFELLVRGLVKDANNIDDSDEELRARLRDMGGQLKALIDANMSSLKQAISANERLMNAVRDAAIQCTPKAEYYTQSGSMTQGARIDAKSPSPVSINQVL